MTQFSNIFSPNQPGDSGGNIQWQDAINLLKLMQNDYEGARRQIEQVSLRFAEREALVNEHIQHAFLSSHGYRTLRLVEYSVGNSINQMGNTMLGGVRRPTKIPVPTQIEIRCLGRFEARSAFGQIERWNSVKAKSVFQYLLIRPHESTIKDTLMEALWPGGSSRTSGNSLKAAVHSLRLSLSEIVADTENPQIILFSQGSYRINPDINLWIDVEEFEKYRTKGHRLEKEHRTAEAMGEFEKAEALYRGDYLEDEPYEEWTLLRREALKDSYLIILNKLATYCLQTGDYENCIHYSQKILSKDYCREDAYRNLMLCYLNLNQRNRALRWYDICCRTIKAELDTTPEKDTIELCEKILNHEISRG